MTQAEFVRRVVAMEDTLYRVSTTILPQLCDRQDAVQSAIEKALRKQEKLRDPNALEADADPHQRVLPDPAQPQTGNAHERSARAGNGPRRSARSV